MKLINFPLLSIIACILASCNPAQNVYEVFPIQDNSSPRLMGRALFPEAPDSIITELGLEDGIPASVCAFLVKTDGKEILFDAANGAPDSQLPSVLESLGISHADIDCIFITHMHGDHVGGLMSNGTAAFPAADLYINKVEYDAWMSMEGQSETLKKIAQAYGERLKTFQSDDVLPYGIQAVEAYGHTPGHTAFRMGDVIIAGDVMHGTALQAKYPEFCAGFDMDKDMSVKTRREILKMAEEGITVYGMHFPAPYYL